MYRRFRIWPEALDRRVAFEFAGSLHIALRRCDFAAAANTVTGRARGCFRFGGRPTYCCRCFAVDPQSKCTTSLRAESKQDLAIGLPAIV